MTPRTFRARVIAPAVAASLATASLIAFSATPASAAKTGFSSTTDIQVGDNNYNPSQTTDIAIGGLAGVPYPSQITTVATAPVIADVDVTITMSHTWPDDIDLLLVGPGGQQALIMSDAGGSNDLVGTTFVLDDEAPTSLPDFAQINAQAYRPANYGNADDTFTAGAPALNGNSDLSVFDGTGAAGTWSLFTHDAVPSFDPGTILDWTLNISYDTVPNPSTIEVTGLPAISDVNVGVQGLTSTNPDDLNLLLVGPGGQQSYLVGDAGGATDISNLNLTFDDEAAGPLPNTDPIVAGSYQPFNQGNIEVFPSPAPVANGNSALSVFDGLSPNGTWSLYAKDDVSGANFTSISGWTLDFTWADTQNPVGTIAVNGGAASTSSTAVTLNLTSVDPAPASGVTQMRFSNDGVTFSAYQAVAATASWTLATGDGVKTVYAQFRDGDGNQSAVVSDAITLALPDTTGPTVTKTTPKKNAKNVKVTTKVKVKVSEALKGSTVTKKTVFLKAKGSSDKVKAKVTYNSSKKMIVLTPNKALKSNKKYKVTVTTKVKDLAGNAFDAKPGKSGAQALKFSFTTA